MLRFYDFHESGNGYKVRLLLSHLQIPHERIEMDILSGETRTPEYLALNPNGRIPHVTKWLARVASQPGAVAIDDVES